MSDDKRFDPTPARRERARREGNVARSAEVGGIAAFAAATVATACVLPFVGGAILASFAALARQPQGAIPFALPAAIAAALLPACAAAVAGGAAALVQGGGLHLTLPRVDVKRLDPIAGLKRMLGAEAAIATARAAFAFALGCAVLWPTLVALVAAGANSRDPATVAHLARDAALRACGACCAIGAVFAVADYALSRRRWLRGLRMSFDEMKRDAKENDGDPHVRGRRKAFHRDLVRNAVSRTREASFVVVNPTHVAVALRYAPPAHPVPEILVRASDDAARRVRAIAVERGLPIVENVPLARLLFATGTSGRAIPPETYVAVAQIVAELTHAGLLT